MLHGSARRTLTVLRLEFASTDLWAVFEAAVEQIASDLDESPVRVNYATRRRTMANWRLPEADWIALCSGIPKLGRRRARNDPAPGTVLVWAQVTQAEPLRSPLLATMRRTGQDTEPLVDEVAQLLTPASQKGSRRELRHRLDRYAAHLATRCDNSADLAVPLSDMFIGVPKRDGCHQ